jgi:hypothetical protein
MEKYRRNQMRLKASYDSRINLIPWSSLPKWVYEQRISDSEHDMGWWYTDSDYINNYEIRFNPLPNDPYVDEYVDEYDKSNNGKVVLYANSKKELLEKLSNYKKDFTVD